MKKIIKKHFKLFYAWFFSFNKKAARAQLLGSSNIKLEQDFKMFVKKTKDQRFILQKRDNYPCYLDATKNTSFDRHYIYHPAWAIRKILKTKPKKHIDISSTLYFSAMVSAFLPVEFYDYRPAMIELDNFTSQKADLLNLPFKDNAILSLSCMHVVEHIGLGRYGDPLDANGDIKAIKELVRVLKTNGNLFFVVPIAAKPRIEFNAHRIYTKKMVVDLFKEQGLKLKEFSLISDNEYDGGIIENPAPKLLARQNFGCGCFWFKKQER